MNYKWTDLWSKQHEATDFLKVPVDEKIQKKCNNKCVSLAHVAKEEFGSIFKMPTKYLPTKV
jgi:hypothetical protein